MKKTIIVSIVCIVVLIILAFEMTSYLSSKKKELYTLKKEYKEMQLEKEEFIKINKKVSKLQNKMSITNVKDVVQAIDEVFSSIGLKHKISSVKPIAKGGMENIKEQQAEVHIEKVNMNEMVNIFYKIENAPFLLVVKNAKLKTSFENPELINIMLTVSLITKK